MIDSYREKTPGEKLQVRAAYPQIVAMLMVCGLSSASFFPHRVPKPLGLMLYCGAFALLFWSLYLRTRAKRLLTSERLHT